LLQKEIFNFPLCFLGAKGESKPTRLSEYHENMIQEESVCSKLPVKTSQVAMKQPKEIL
jgi:hypothetical protein